MSTINIDRIILASDHSGIEVKKAIIKHLENTHQLIDLGPFDCDISVDYSNYGIECAKKAVEYNCLGIVICGTGIGISIAANKVKGARCALLYNDEVAKLAKMHNNANVISFGSRQFSEKEIIQMLEIFLATKFEDGRHQKRLDIIANFEKNN